jgi:hypothetical protein
VASPSRYPIRDEHTTQFGTRATSRKISIPKGRWAPTVIDPDHPQTGGIFAVFHQLGQAAGLMTMYALMQTAGNYKAGHPEDWEIPESEFMAVCNTECADTVRKAKRALEARNIFPKYEGTGKGRRFSVGLEGIDALAAEGPPPARKAPKCKPRTEPERVEVVIVRVPGSQGELPINDACSNAGGKGAKCACPLHAISATRFVDTEAVNGTLPRTQSGLANGEWAQTPLPSHAPVKPQKPLPRPVAPLSPTEERFTVAELRAYVEPLCLKVWDRLPEGEDFFQKIGEALHWRRGSLVFIRSQILDCAGIKSKRIGLLPDLARSAYKAWFQKQEEARSTTSYQVQTAMDQARDLYSRADEEGRADLRRLWAGMIDFEPKERGPDG